MNGSNQELKHLKNIFFIKNFYYIDFNVAISERGQPKLILNLKNIVNKYKIYQYYDLRNSWIPAIFRDN